MYFDGNTNDKKVHVQNPFFTSASLLAVMQKASSKASNRECITWMGMGDNWPQKLTSFGTDGAAINLM